MRSLRNYVDYNWKIITDSESFKFAGSAKINLPKNLSINIFLLHQLIEYFKLILNWLNVTLFDIRKIDKNYLFFFFGWIFYDTNSINM